MLGCLQGDSSSSLIRWGVGDRSVPWPLCPTSTTGQPGFMAQGKNLLVCSAWLYGAEWFAVPTAVIPSFAVTFSMPLSICFLGTRDAFEK